MFFIVWLVLVDLPSIWIGAKIHFVPVRVKSDSFGAAKLTRRGSRMLCYRTPAAPELLSPSLSPPPTPSPSRRNRSRLSRPVCRAANTALQQLQCARTSQRHATTTTGTPHLRNTHEVSAGATWLCVQW